MTQIDLQQFREMYLIESLELLDEMETRLMALGNETHADTEELNAIFRCAHSIKGGAGAFGFDRIARFTHTLEALLDLLRERRLQASPEVVDCLLRARDVVLEMMHAAQSGTALPDDCGEDSLKIMQRWLGDSPSSTTATATPEAPRENTEMQYRIAFAPHAGMMATGNEPILLLRELSSLGVATITPDISAIGPLAEHVPDKCYLSWQIELRTHQPEARIREVFEFVEDECELTITQLPGQPAMAQTQAPQQAQVTPAATNIRVDIEKVDRLINLVGEVVITQSFLMTQARGNNTGQHGELLRGIEEMMHHTRELQEAVMAIRMQPVKSIFSRFPRLVRDLAQQLGKEVSLRMVGEQTEVDKTIIEQLTDPLTHMIRNSLDHGIEAPDVRRSAGKSPCGEVVLSAEHRGGRIVIEVRDDGAGICRERVLAKAIQRGIVPPEATLPDEAIDMLIFEPGFSTAEAVSSVSGRGVGMDVVRRNIEALGGSVSILNHPGKGAGISISLPLTLAILDGMIVRCGQECYIIPISHIVETLRPKAAQVRPVAGGSHVINIRGAFIPICLLRTVFGVHGAVEDVANALVVLVEAGTQMMGIVVDELIGQQQVVIKSLEEHTDPIDGISGATILGDGKVSLILDVAKLYRMQMSGEKPPHPSPISLAA